MTLPSFGSKYIDGLVYAVRCLNLAELEKAALAIQACQGTVWLIGNGGSATLASHMATDLQLAGVRAISLTDVAAVTTYGNDFGYSASFAGQVDVMCMPGDVVIAISGSGKSDNIHEAVMAAKAKGAFVIGVFGHGGDYGPQVNLLLQTVATRMGPIQDLEQVMLHVICYWLMERKKAQG